MKGVFFFYALICTISSHAIPITGNNNKSTLTSIIETKPLKDALSKVDFKKFTIQNFEKYIGKKLSLKEKIVFKIVQHRFDKGRPIFKKPATANTGKTALILGIIGLVLLFVPYAIIASIPLAILAIVLGNEAKKIDPKDKKARTGVVLGWVTLGLIMLFLILAIIIVAAFLVWFG